MPIPRPQGEPASALRVFPRFASDFPKSTPPSPNLFRSPLKLAAQSDSVHMITFYPRRPLPAVLGMAIPLSPYAASQLPMPATMTITMTSVPRQPRPACAPFTPNPQPRSLRRPPQNLDSEMDTTHPIFVPPGVGGTSRIPERSPESADKTRDLCPPDGVFKPATSGQNSGHEQSPNLPTIPTKPRPADACYTPLGLTGSPPTSLAAAAKPSIIKRLRLLP